MARRFRSGSRAIVLAGAVLLATTHGAAGERRLGSQLDDIIALPAGRWVEITRSADGRIPDTHLARVTPPQQGHPAWGTQGPRALMSAWSGGAYAPELRLFVVMGGGHSAYGGNEVYGFNLDRLEWRRLTEPSAYEGLETVDGTPRASHTYDGIEWLPGPKRFLLLVSGAPYPRGVGTGKTTWLFDPTGPRWERKTDVPTYMMGAMSGVDPDTGQVYAMAMYHLLRFDPVADKWTALTGKDNFYSDGTGEFDPVRRRLVALNNQGLWICSIGRLARCQVRPPLAVEGDDVPPPAAGLAYHPGRDTIVAWGGGRQTWELNLNSLAWKAWHNSTGAAPGNGRPDPSGKPTPTSWRVFGRWRYVPHWNAFIGVNAIDRNVWVYRLPAPDR